ncbi:MAG: hypothetical protein AB7F35_21810 [Acetobacteraceae bacterium]
MLWAYVLARAVASAAFVVTVTALAERVGPFWGGLIVALPISAGPAYVLLALQHSDAFIAASTVGSLAANAVTVLFILVIVKLAPRAPWPVTLGAAIATWLLFALGVRQVAWTLVSATALNVVAFAACLWLVRRERLFAGTAIRPGRRAWYELPLRAVMVGVLVAAVVTASDWMGPTVTGMAAVFPIMLSGLALVALPRLGGAAAAALFASTMRAMPGFALALFVLNLTVEPLGAWWGMATAIAAQLCFAATLLLRRQAGPRSTT